MTLQRLGEPQNHRETRDFHSAFELADEGVIGAAEVGEGGLGEASLDAQVAEALTEDDAFGLRLHRHGQDSLAFPREVLYAMTYR